jgi:glycosyltransferase involved in cell wall biosynthesis
VNVEYFGTYDRTYPRNAQVITCLRRAGVNVVEVHASVWEGRHETWNAGVATALRLAAAETRLALRPRRLPADVDAMIVGYPGHVDMPLARRAARDRPLVFNPLVSLADTLISDRGRFGPRSLPARLLERLDRVAFSRADVVVADTEAHAEFFRGLTTAPVEVCFVGAEERLFRPEWEPADPFTVLFVGKLIPLQGIDVVLDAARLASDLNFRVVGSGQLAHLLDGAPDNVEHVPWVEYDQLPHELRRAGCALGIFGTSDKAARVIPNKAFQALACGVPLVTADTPAARELLVNGESAILVPAGNAQALADAIRRLEHDADLRGQIAEGGRAAYEAQASEAVLGEQWRGILERATRS